MPNTSALSMKSVRPQPLARQIEAATGCESRSVVLGHLQRGGTPVGYDRLLAQRMGCAAVRYLAETDKSGLVAESRARFS